MDRFSIALGKDDSIKRFLKETEFIEETAMDRDNCSSCEIVIDNVMDCVGCPYFEE